MRDTTLSNLPPSERTGKRMASVIRRGFTYLAAFAVSLSCIASVSAQTGPGGLVFFGDRVIKETMASTAPLTQVAGGSWFTAGLRADGTAVAWGFDQYGQCDLPSGLTGISQVATGKTHTLLLLANGTVIARGFDNYGQIDVPVGLTNVVQIAAGDYTSYALKADGTIVVWGWLSSSLGPPPGLTNVVQIVAGEAHAIALKSDGSVVCWGQDTHHECDYPGGPKNVVAISAAYEHSAALRSDGTVTCWGNDDYLQSDVPAGLKAVKIALGPTHSLALKADGTVVGWGSNYSGEATAPASVKNISSIFAGPTASYAIDSSGKTFGWGDSLYGQTTIPNALYDVSNISAGFGHILMLKHDGSLSAWGRNNEQQCNLLGTAATGYSFVSAGATHSAASITALPSQDLFGDDSWLQTSIPASAGSTYDKYWAFGTSTYAHKISGGVAGYGRNLEGQLGLTSQGDFVQIAGGLFHSIGLKANGTVVTAGSDSNGQQDIPTGLGSVVQVAAGYAHNLALLNNGTVAAWGMNSSGQTKPPTGLSNVVQVSGGHEHSVALQSNGTVVAWGGSSFGQSTIPNGLAGIAQIGAGEYYTVCLPKMTMSVAPYSVSGGKTAIGTLYIPAPAPANGVSVNLASNSAYAAVTSNIVIPSGATSKTFVITTTNPSTVTQPIITATVGSLSQSSLLTIHPTEFTMVTSIPSVVGGSTQPVTLSVTLAHPAPAGGATISLLSSDPSLVVPSQIVVAANTQTKQITLSDVRVHVATPVTITGSYSSTVAVDAFTVNPFQLTFFSLNPATATSGSTTLATITLNSVTASPVTVQIVSSNNSAIAGPLTLTVPANANTGTLSITPGSVTTNTSLTLTASLDGSSILRDVGVSPAVAITTSVQSVVGGSTSPATFTITLPVAAPVGGASVTVLSSDPSISLSSPVVIAAGQTAKTITLTPSRVHMLTSVTLSAKYGPTTALTGITVAPFKVTVFNVAPVPVDGGGRTYGTATLNATPTSSVVVTLNSSNNSVVPGPISLTVPANGTQGTAAILTNNVLANTSVTVAATLDGSVYNNQFMVDSALSKLTLSPSTVYGGSMLTGTLTLQVAAPVGGLSVNLTTTNGQLPTSTCVVAAGQTVGTFQVSANDLSAVGQMSVTAKLGPQSITATATINPNRIVTFVVSPTTYKGSGTVRVVGTVTISAVAAYDVYVNGSSTNSTLAGMPALITIPAGKTSASFNLTHGATSRTTAVTVTATRAGASKVVKLTVN